MKKKVKLSALKKNEDNPRIIKQEKLKQLIESVDKYSFMLSLKPITIDEDGIIIGGNQRYEALKALGETHADVQIYGKKEHEKEMLKYQKQGKELISYAEAREFFIVEDNVSAGKWDFDMLANNFDNEWLVNIGVDVWNPMQENEFQPSITPTFETGHINAEEIKKAKEGFGKELNKGKGRNYLECICPECAHEFNVEI